MSGAPSFITFLTILQLHKSKNLNNPLKGKWSKSLLRSSLKHYWGFGVTIEISGHPSSIISASHKLSSIQIWCSSDYSWRTCPRFMKNNERFLRYNQLWIDRRKYLIIKGPVGVKLKVKKSVYKIKKFN